MYLKLPADYVDPASQTPLPDAVLAIATCELRLRAGDVRVTTGVWSSAGHLGIAQPLSQSTQPALSTDEIAAVSPDLLKSLYTVLQKRPGFGGTTLTGAPPESGSYTDIWRWDQRVGTAPPASGRLTTDSGNWSGAALVLLSSTNTFGTDRIGILRTLLQPDNELFVALAGNTETWVHLNISAAPTEASGYFTIPVTRLDIAGSAPPNNADLRVSIRVKGV
jgi:hypothetical protein